jgi:hypothetical protein
MARLIPFSLALLSLSSCLGRANTKLFPFNPPPGYGAATSSPLVSEGFGENKQVLLNQYQESIEDSYKGMLYQEPYVWAPADEEDVPELSALSMEHFTRVGHPLFPHHSIRIKQTKGWCDPNVK